MRIFKKHFLILVTLLFVAGLLSGFAHYHEDSASNHHCQVCHHTHTQALVGLSGSSDIAKFKFVSIVVPTINTNTYCVYVGNLPPSRAPPQV